MEISPIVQFQLVADRRQRVADEVQLARRRRRRRHHDDTFPPAA